jgi:hypothetical protein
MQLLILLLIAGVIGYFVARSRFSRSIDDATEKVADSSRGMADKAEGWWRRTFGKKDQATAGQVIEGSAVDANPKPAEKQPSRRKSSDTTPESGE